MKYFLMLLLCAQPMAAQTLSVIHEKSLWMNGHGKLEITEEGIAYKSEKAKESYTWKYIDIQYFDRISNKEFTILSYKDLPLLLGRDKEYHFLVTEGELTDELFQTICARLNKPVTDRVFPEVTAVEYQVPVKHLHTFGGCQGVLKFTRDSIYYETDDKKDARDWKLSQDVQSVWSMDRYQLEIFSYDNNRREFSHTRPYHFQLKQPLDPVFYRNLKLKLYDLEVAHLPIQ